MRPTIEDESMEQEVEVDHHQQLPALTSPPPALASSHPKTTASIAPFPAAAAAAAPLTDADVDADDPESSVVFRIRVLELDHYMSAPSAIDSFGSSSSSSSSGLCTSLFSHLPISLLPVMRVWGRT